jgi:bacteriocin-like protein
MKEEFTMNNLKKLDTFKTLNSNDLKQINGGVIMIGYKIGKYIANKLLN